MWNFVTYLLLDLDIFILYCLYRQTKVNRRKQPDYSYALCFFGFFAFSGFIEIIMLVALRLSHEGKVCSGDFLKENDPKYNDNTSDYYMRYEGNFVIFLLIYVSLCAVSFAYQYYKINSQIDYNDSKLMMTFVDKQSLQEHSRAVQFVLDQLKFKPRQSKFKQLQFIEKIQDKFIFTQEMESSMMGVTYYAVQKD